MKTIASMLIFAAALLLSACTSTVAPTPVQAKQASEDGNDQNSGIFARLPDKGYEVTAHWVARYNALIAAGFDKQIGKKLKRGDGVRPLPKPVSPAAVRDRLPTFEVDDEHLVDQIQMQAKKDTPKAP